MDQAARGPGSPSPQALVAAGAAASPWLWKLLFAEVVISRRVPLTAEFRPQTCPPLVLPLSSPCEHIRRERSPLPFVMRSLPSPGGARLPAFPSTAHFPAPGSGSGGEDPGRLRRGPSRSEASGGKGGVDNGGAALPLPPRRPGPPSLPLPAAPGPLRPCRAQPQPGSFGRAGGPGGQRSDHVPAGRLLDLSSLLRMEASGQRTGRVPQTWVRF